MELEEVLQLALEVGLLRADGRRSDDRSALLELELRGLLAELVALLVLEPARDADALAVGHVDEVTPGDRELHREPRALRLQRVLDHLDDDLLAGLEHLADLLALAAAAAAAAALDLDAGQDDVVNVQEAVAVEADVDERRLESGQDVVHLALVDVADDRARAAALDVELRDAPVAVLPCALPRPRAAALSFVASP